MRELEIQRLPGTDALVRWLEHARFTPEQAVEPHRHDFHELIWVREGSGHHLLDGRRVPIRARTVTSIGRGQVHVFVEGVVSGAVVRFAPEALEADARVVAGARDRVIDVPAGEVGRFEDVLRALEAEIRRPPDPFTVRAQRHLLALVLAWLERWNADAHQEWPDAEADLYRRFRERLERDFSRHHDAGHYADALRVPAATLSRALGDATGRATKELILDRVMLEAARLLRFTDLSVGEIAFRVGFTDALYFSRAFKRHQGDAPSAYRRKIHASADSAHGSAAEDVPS